MVAAVVTGVALLATSGLHAQQQPVSRGCAEIVAVLEQGGGGLSAEEVAKKTHTDVETVRSCTDQWRAAQKDPKGPKASTGATQPIAPGCEKIVAVLDQGGGGLSAEEVAKKTSTDVETVRNCTDQWRRSMKGSPSP
jgi:transposase